MTATDTVEAEGREDGVVVECDLDAAPEKVWRALTVPELVEQWLGVRTADAAAGAEPRYEIVEAEPFSRLRYAWRDPQVTEPDTIVTFDLSPLPGGGTWFRLTHGIAADSRATVAAANSNSPPLALAA
jgi:uncharacterized protein YndB with AHSA1/START domain